MKKLLIVFSVVSAGIGQLTVAQELPVANPFIQPIDTTLNWYGSGDANGDDTLTWDDVARMQELIDGTFSDQTDNRLKDRADVDYNGVVESSDRLMLEQHLTDYPFFYPSWYYSKLNTSGQVEMILNAMRIDDSELTCLEIPQSICDCHQYSIQMYINFRGISQDHMEYLDDLGGFQYNFEDNGRFNLPLLLVSIDVRDEFGRPQAQFDHEMNTIVLGPNLLLWSSLCNIEPQEISPSPVGNIYIQPGQAFITGKFIKDIIVRGPPENPYTGGFYSNYCKYEINLFNISFKEVYFLPYYLLITQKDYIPPSISTTLENGKTYGSGSTAIISVSDTYFKRAWYSIDEGSTKTSLSEGVNTISLPSEEGDYPVYIYAGDDFYNEVLERIDITIEEGLGIGTSNEPSSEVLRIFPIPADDIVMIEYKPAKATRIEVWDVSGKQMDLLNNLDGTGEIVYDLSGFEAGYYSVVAKDVTGKITGIKGLIKY